VRGAAERSHPRVASNQLLGSGESKSAAGRAREPRIPELERRGGNPLPELGGVGKRQRPFCSRSRALPPGGRGPGPGERGAAQKRGLRENPGSHDFFLSLSDSPQGNSRSIPLHSLPPQGLGEQLFVGNWSSGDSPGDVVNLQTSFPLL
jgi:hypothetical protein